MGLYGYTSCPSILDDVTIRLAYAIAVPEGQQKPLTTPKDMIEASNGLLFKGHGCLLGAIHAILRHRTIVVPRPRPMRELLRLEFPGVAERYPEKNAAEAA